LYLGVVLEHIDNYEDRHDKEICHGVCFGLHGFRKLHNDEAKGESEAEDVLERAELAEELGYVDFNHKKAIRQHTKHSCLFASIQDKLVHQKV
jgi:hypothetical protein